MPRTAQNVQVGKRKIELSNLEKVLFPDDHFLKAELIQYYLKIAPTILAHIKGRPLSLVRYPDGIYGEKFYQKNRPEWAPDWIEYVTLGEEAKDYILATEEASLVWLANLACIELHQMHSRKPHYDQPDYFVFDLDPPEDYPFPDVVEIAFALREHVESFGYHPFVKTTGGKGLHVLAPIEPKWDFHTVFEAAQAIAKPFVEAHAKETTLHIKKDARKGKVLVDIYRNRGGQSIVSAYSVRGRAGAPVSMPLSWEQLAETSSPAEWNMQTAIEKVIAEGDALEAIGAYAVALHTERKPPKTVKPLPPSRKRKTPEALKTYEKKRSFEKTPEPRPIIPPRGGTPPLVPPRGGIKGGVPLGEGNAFVVHRHHASRLHYDLRLEKDGTLKSWAVPKGLPPRPGIKRLAVTTEDHPLEYLNFDGTIPKGQYGGGEMWIFAQGKYEFTKVKKDGFYFRLNSRELNAEYRMYQTRGNEWLLERVDAPQVDWLRDRIEPMLANSDKKPPTSDDFLFEVKWDGIRATIILDEGQMRIISRGHRDVSKQFPELLIPDKAFRGTCAVFDTEIVCLEEDGRPSFKQVINRLMQRSETGIERGKQKYPVVCYVFDCLYLDGRPIMHEPLTKRREWMADAVRKDSPYRVSEAVDEGMALFEAAKTLGLEGIIAKDRTSAYLPGKRSNTWLKIKTRQTMDCVIIGYTKGKGDRSSLFGALHIGEQNGDGLEYRGKVGTGYDFAMMKTIFTEIQKMQPIKRMIKQKPLDDAQTIWIEPKLLCEVQYSSLTKDGMLREPVFLRLRPDLMEDEV